MTGGVLVAGVGNVFLGDDGFGVEVVARLSTMELPDQVLVVDYGIRGMHLAYDLAGAGDRTTILVDATSRGDPPGTVSVIELDTAVAAPASPVLDAHGMQPDVVFGLVGVLGGTLGRVLLVGCEPATTEQHMGLSPPVLHAVDTAVGVVLDLLAPGGLLAIGEPSATRKEPTCASAYLAK